MLAFSFGNSFSSIASGGDPEMTLEAFTGASTITDFDASGSSWTSDVYNGASLTMPNGQNNVTFAVREQRAVGQYGADGSGFRPFRG